MSAALSGIHDEFPVLVQASAAGAMAVCALTTPLDVARHSAQAVFSRRVAAAGFTEAFRTAAAPGVFRGLWRALPVALCHSALSPAVFLVAYESQKGYKEAMQAGAYARVAQTVVLQPLDFLVTCRQACGGAAAAPHLQRSFYEVITRDRWRSLWRGLIPTLLRDVTFSCTFWFAYSGLRSPVISAATGGAMHEVSSGRRPPASVYIATSGLGACCGALSAFITQPFDVVKTRMQVHELVKSDKHGWRKVRIARVFATLSAAHTAAGISGLWTGGVARALKFAAAGVILGPYFEHCHFIADDLARPINKAFYLREEHTREDTSGRIVHPRSTQNMFIDVRGG